MNKKCLLMVIAIVFLCAGCNISSSSEIKRKEYAYNCYKEYHTLLQNCSNEAIEILEHYDLNGTRIYASEEGRVYIEAIDMDISSENLSDALDLFAKVIIVEKEVVSFLLNSSGIGSNTDYSGIYFSSTDNLNSCPYLLHGLQLTYKDGIVIGSKEGSDNSVYVERIGTGFFYFSLTF